MRDRKSRRIRKHDDAAVDGILGLGELAQLLARTHGHHGRGRLQSVLQSVSGSSITRSEAEERLLSLLRAGRSSTTERRCASRRERFPEHHPPVDDP
ncbi:MAG: hypothetical protein WAL63_19960, partial [Solirubrobacteraceae bacterium]